MASSNQQRARLAAQIAEVVAGYENGIVAALEDVYEQAVTDQTNRLAEKMAGIRREWGDAIVNAALDELPTALEVRDLGFSPLTIKDAEEIAADMREVIAPGTE